jgi:hypothetical protein
MNNRNASKSKLNWFLDFLVLAAFLLSFFLDFTGVALHQWLGVGLFLMVLLHLANHFSWVTCVFDNFFGKTSNRARLYALIDSVLFSGFLMIVFTGLVISTWLKLYFTNYEAWVRVHVFASIGTLLVAVIKIGLHWRWIVTQAGKIFKPASVNQGKRLPEPHPRAISRRQFLVTMGMVSLGSAIAISNVLPRIRPVKSFSGDTNAELVDPESTSVTDYQAVQTTQPATSVTVQEQQPTATSIPEQTASATPQPTQAAVACSYRCRKGNHCAYPGRCHDYQDANNNGLCDLGECL